MDGDELLTIPMAAQRLNVSHMTIRRYIDSGLLKPIRPGRDYLIPADQLVGFQRPKTGPKPKPTPPPEPGPPGGD